MVNNMSHVMKKPVFLHMLKLRLRSAAFIFATLIVQSLYFLKPKLEASSHLLWLFRPVLSDLVGNPKDRFSHDATHARCKSRVIIELHREKKKHLEYAKTKKQISFAVTVKLISAFVFAT